MASSEVNTCYELTYVILSHIKFIVAREDT